MRYLFEPPGPGHIITGPDGIVRAGDEVNLTAKPAAALLAIGLRPIKGRIDAPKAAKPPPERGPASPAAPVEAEPRETQRPTLDGLHHSEVRSVAKRLGWDGEGKTAGARGFLETVDDEDLANALG